MTIPPRTQRRERVAALLRGMTQGLIEREEPARLLLLAALAGEHALLIGPPGTAKSELAKRLRACVSGGSYFERLLTRFSVPEELFGPLSIKSLEQDEYRRLTEGYLPTASVAFLDEVFHTNSVILNPLLTLLDDREYDNGGGAVSTPLVSVIGASNQTPEGPQLEALHDRFLLRFSIQPVSGAAFGALLDPDRSAAQPWLQGELEPFSSEELAQIRQEASAVALPASVRGVLQGLREGLGEKGIWASDRRWRKIASLLRVAAYCDGRDAVGLVDCWLALHCLWSRPEQIPVVLALLTSLIDAALVGEPRRFQAMAEAFEQQIGRELTKQEPACDEQGQPLFLDERGLPTTESHHSHQVSTTGGEWLFRAPPGFPAPILREGVTLAQLWEHWFQHRTDGLDLLENWTSIPSHRITHRVPREPLQRTPTYEPKHVAARRRQLGELLSDIRAFQRGIASLRREGEDHLWVAREHYRSVLGRIEEASSQLSAVGEGLVRTVEAVSKLPTRAP